MGDRDEDQEGTDGDRDGVLGKDRVYRWKKMGVGDGGQTGTRMEDRRGTRMGNRGGGNKG